MHFPIAGITVSPLLPVVVGFLIASICSPCGVSGVFLLVPFQMSFLGFVSPAVSSTSQLYNIIGLPGGVMRYIKEGRMAWGLFWVMVIGTLPGMAAGALIRVRYLTDPKDFKVFVGMILLYPGFRLLNEALLRFGKKKEKNLAVERELIQQAEVMEGDAAAEVVACLEETEAVSVPKMARCLPKEAVITGRSLSLKTIEYDFWGETYTVNTMVIAVMSLVVGVISGIYGIGGSVFTASFIVAFLGLPVFTIAGATLGAAFVASTFGVIFYMLLALTPLGAGSAVSPDWLLGLLFGIGGFAGNYFGAFLQKFVPDRLARGTMGTLVTSLAVAYVGQYFLVFAGPVLQTVRAIF
ncbi:MAG TPA: sulfite exporter TauE/SafE family protein [Spirochaetia bacterium]|nr:sulfite exporter TauE/SafE family protein [Spirochaetia bacterium]